MFKTFKYRLFPTPIQKRLIAETVETCRHWYNACLAERKTVWETEKRTVGKYEQLRHVKELKATNPFAANVHSHILQGVVSDLDKAFQSFFRRVKAKETPGYPRFRARGRYRSFSLKEYGNGFRLDGRRLKLSGIGRVAVRWHRPIEGIIKTVRIINENDKWFACFACELDTQPLAPTGKQIGVDVGLSALLTMSDGAQIENPKWYRASQKHLRVLQRTVARRVKGGVNRYKAVGRLAKHSAHVARQRKDFINKVVCHLVEANDLIAIEDLQVSNMVRNPSLAKSIMDAGWGIFRSTLNGKAEYAGRVVVAVNPAYTSMACSNCGTLFQDFNLSVRWVTCECGLSMNRDHNAACNILKGRDTPFGS